MSPFGLHEAVEKATLWKKRGLTVVFTNGVFDLLHVGHVRYLRTAKSFGDKLIVGVNSDESVRRIKGPLRPIVQELDRAELVAALEPVDMVALFDEPTASSLIEAIKPQIYVKGEDWKERRLPEEEAVLSCGGTVKFAPLTSNRSSTDIVRIILQRYCRVEDDR